MPEHEKLLADILTHPGETDRMLVYADWLEEQDDTRADYLRLQVDLRDLDRGTPEHAACMARIRGVYPASHPSWLGRLEQAGVVEANLTPYPEMWWGVGLGEAREAQGTYTGYEYGRQPPLPVEQFDGTLSWLAQSGLPVESPSGTVPDKEVWAETLDGLTQKGYRIPSALRVLMMTPKLQAQLPSCTANFFMPCDWSQACPIEDADEGAVFQPFYSDQQSVVRWGVWLAPGQDYAPVLGSPPDFPDNDDDPVTYPELTFQAPSVEAFMFRFWIENHIWFATQWGEGRELTSDEQTYMAHLRGN